MSRRQQTEHDKAPAAGLADPPEDEGVGLQIEVDRSDLAAAIGRVERFAARNSLRPVLQCLRIRAASGQVDVEASDGDVFVQNLLPAERLLIHREGQVCVAVEILGLIASAAGGAGRLTIENRIVDGRCRLFAGDDEDYRLLAADAEDWRSAAALEGPPAVIVAAAELRRAILDVERFALRGQNRQRYSLEGIELRVRPGKMTLTATDRRSLASATVPTRNGRAGGGGRQADRSVVLPSRPMHHLVGGIDPSAEDDEAEIWILDTQVAVRAGPMTLWLPTLLGGYPDSSSMVAADRPGRITIERGALAAAVRRARTMLATGSRMISLTAEGGTLTVAARTWDPGERSNAAQMAGFFAGEGQARICVPAAYEGPSITVTLPGSRLLDALEALAARECETVVLEVPHLPDAAQASPSVRIQAAGYVWICALAGPEHEPVPRADGVQAPAEAVA